MPRTLAALALLLVALPVLAAPMARLEGAGRAATLTLAADVGQDRSPLVYTVALPPSGGWRVAAVELDGLAVAAEGSVALGNPYVHRRARGAQLRFEPPREDWLTAVIRLRFDAPLPAAGRALDDPLLAGLFLNPEHVRLREPARGSLDRDGDEIFDGSSRWIRVDVTESGIYRLDYQTLWANGVNPGTDTGGFRLLGTLGSPQPFRVGDEGGSWERGWTLSEVPLRVVGGAEFNPDSEVFCYLPGPDGFASEADPDAGWQDYRRHPFSSRASYYFTWGGTPGLRVGEADASVGGGEPVFATLPARVHVEQDFLYSNHYLHEDGWAWHYFLPTSNPETFGNNLQLSWPAADGDFTMRVGFDAPRDHGLPSGPHHLRAYLGRADLGGQIDAEHLFFDETFSIVTNQAQIVLEGTRTLPGDMEGLREAQFSLVLPKDPPTGLAQDFGYLLWYEVYHETRARTLFDTPVELHVPDGQPAAEIRTSGWSEAPELWDVTDPAAPLRLTGGAWAGDSLRAVVTTPTRRHLIAFDPSRTQSLEPAAAIQVAPTPLRNEARPHMVVIAFDGFRAAADRYAAYRRANYPLIGQGEVEVVSVSDIYANFGCGMLDPAAIRNFVKYRYEAADPGQPSRLGIVLLLGDADSDYRNRLGRETLGDGTNALVPSLSDRFRTDLLNPYTTDDYFCEMDVEDDVVLDCVPDVAIGRLPATTLAGAEAMVDRVIAYERDVDPGPWKNRMILAADDYFTRCNPNDPDNIPHTEQTEALVSQSIPWDADLEKIYMCTMDCDFAGFKPQAQQRLFAELNDGVLLFNYVGHGGNDVLADEQLLITSRLFSLRNDRRRFFFVSASCNVGEFDDPNNESMTETMVGHDEGGAIATMASSALSLAHFNNVLNRNLFEALFPDRTMQRAEPLGPALLRAKVQTQLVDLGNSRVGDQNERYAILGDPALTLATPRLTVEFTAGEGDTLQVGAAQSLSGRVLRGGMTAADFNGELRLSVRASADTTGCLRANGTTVVPFHLPGPEIYRGRIAVREGRFTSPAFFVPGLPEGSLGRYGRIRAFATDAAEALGSLDSIQVLPGILPSDDTPPTVGLSLAGGVLSGTPGMELSLRAESPSGINFVGNHPRNAIFLEYVEAGLIENLTDQFEYDTGSATRGEVISVLPSGLPDGLNTLVASVADNLGNVGRDTLRVRVFEEGRADLRDVQPFPNPFAGRVAISFALTSAAHVTCDLYTLSGRRLRSLEKDCPAAGRYGFDWDGRDAEGDEVANGTYLYRLVATYAEDASRKREETGAVVRMRE